MPRVLSTSTNVRGYIPQEIDTENFSWPISFTEGTSLARSEFQPAEVSAPILFLQAALRRAHLERLEDGEWFSEAPECPGVWGKGGTELESLKDFVRALEEWIRLKLKDHDKDFPVLDSVNLNLL